MKEPVTEKEKLEKINNKVQEIFKKIEKVSSIDMLKNIERDFEEKYRLKESYPKIDFCVPKKDIESLIKDKIINSEDFSFNNSIAMSRLKTPLEKLFYAMAWKGGHLLKLKHIIKGINDADRSNEMPIDVKSAFVYYQFGRHLTDSEKEPILDQHILRSFVISKLDDSKEMVKYLELSQIKEKHWERFNDYKDWLNSLNKINKIKDYGYYVDRILFALGKQIKSTWKYA